MGVVIETCVKYPGGPTRMRATDLKGLASRQQGQGHFRMLSVLAKHGTVAGWGMQIN
jgi:hypothetical protein